MLLLLTTSKSFLLLNTDNGQFQRIDSGRGLYYGIAHHADNIYVAARNRLVSCNIDPAEERGEILVFDRALQPCASLRAPFPLRDLHEIAWYDNKLWATSSYDNMIAVYDGQRWEQWFPLVEQDVGDINHFNSLMFDDAHVWILAHNRGPSELMAFSLRTRELVQKIMLGNCGHNIWREDEQLYSCSSAEGKLRGEHGFVLETGGFPRGVAFDADTRCVGVSALAERKARDFTSGKLMVFTRDWAVRHEIDLAGEGLILDLLQLPPGFALNSKQPSALGAAWAKLTALLQHGAVTPASAREKFFEVR